MIRLPARRTGKRYFVATFLSAWIATATWQVFKPLPPGTHVRSATMQTDASTLRFHADLTYLDMEGERRSDQAIFEAVFETIDEAHSFVIADFFLLNDSMGETAGALRPLSSQVVERLLARKTADPNIRMLLITDPVNDIYGGADTAVLERLRAGGIDVVITDLRRLRDSNPAYSALWRLFGQWWGNTPDSGLLPNPFGHDPPHVTLRSWLALLNFKANHRKLIVADRADGSLTGIVTSANPHDASSAHSNVALQIAAPLAAQLAAAELEVARFSGWSGDWHVPTAPQTASGPGADVAQITYLTEAAIREQLVTAIDGTRAGDRVQLAMFYLAEREVIAALLRAAERGAQVQLILDPNKDAFGRQKDGVPNRPVAHELVRESDGRIEVRWYRTTGEQFHTKLTLITTGERVMASLGSANLTRRNVGDYNLEANLVVELAPDTLLGGQMQRYFARLWHNENGQYTLPFASYEDPSRLRYWQYRFMEATGFSTF